jgi:hypothetical protein
MKGDAGLAPTEVDVEFITREVGDEIFILAAKREGKTLQVKFTGLPAVTSPAEVMFEEPRKVEVKDGVLQDWFGPDEVHVYRMKRAR